MIAENTQEPSAEVFAGTQMRIKLNIKFSSKNTWDYKTVLLSRRENF